MADELQRSQNYRHAKFHQNSSSSCRDIAIFPFYKMAAGGHLGFINSRNLNGWQKGPRCIIVLNFIKIGQKVAEISRFSNFQDGGCPPSWMCLPRFWTTQETYLMIFTGMQNLIVIQAVV